MSRTYGKAQDLIDFTRASSGTALRRVKYGAELVTNGTFDSDVSGWSSSTTFASTGASIGGEFVVSTASASGRQVSAITCEVGKVYAVTANARFSTGSGTALIGVSDSTSGSSERGFVVTASTSSVPLSLVFIATLTTHYITAGNGSSGVGDKIFDNISVKEVTFDTSDGDLILFNHPNNIPRIEYDADGNVLGLLVEESRTNLVTYSEDASQWPVVGAPTVTNNIATAPDGTQTVDGIQDISGDSFERIKAFNSTVTANSTVTGSIFIKKEISETNYGGLTLAFTGGSGQAFYGIIDAVNGTIVNPSSGLTASFTVTDAGDFWRMSMTATDTGSNTQLEFSVYGTLSANGTSIGTGIGSVRRFWGAQLESASFPTSYIPTSGSTATRSADVASLSTSAFGYRQDEGTLYAEASVFDSDSGTSVALFLGNDTSNYVNIYTQYSAYYRSASVGGSVSSGNIVLDTGDPISNSSKVATSWKYGSSFNASRDGSLGTGYSDFVALTDNPDAVYVGSRNAATSSFLNGHIKSLKYYPRRLTNAQLQELTS